MFNYVFRNTKTGEIRRAASFYRNSAARLAGLDVPFRGSLPKPWALWECWESPTKCLWAHADSSAHWAGDSSEHHTIHVFSGTT